MAVVEGRPRKKGGRLINKRLLAATGLGIVVVLAACAQAPAPAPAAATDPAADEEKLKADALSWFDHYASANAEGMANLYAEDALLMPPGAPAVTGRPGIQAFLGDDAAKSKVVGISLKNVAVTGAGVSGDLGWISGTYAVLDGSGATIDTGNYLSVHHRKDGVWLYIRDTWNSDRAPARS